MQRLKNPAYWEFVTWVNNACFITFSEGCWYFSEKTTKTKYRILPLTDIQKMAQTENAKKVWFFGLFFFCLETDIVSNLLH